MHKRIFQIIISSFLILILLLFGQSVIAQKGGRAIRGNNGGGSRSIKGGSVKSPTRQKPTAPANNRSYAKKNSRPTNGTANITAKPNTNNNIRTPEKNNLGNNNSINKPNNGSNKINIDNSKTNINVNVNNSHNTTVRRNTNYRPYARPPHRYGGYRYNCYHPYYYHPYRPFYWGPVWHPWGFFIATLAVTAVVISIENQQYHYDKGVYYVSSNSGYVVVSAPIGATITTLPENSQTVVVNETTNNYYYGGTYYEKSNDGYTVVPPTAGTVVENLPEGGEEVKIGDITYVKVGETYYQPIEQEGKNMYEVVDVEKDTE